MLGGLLDKMDDLGKLLVIELRKELLAQGHKATGKLAGSIEYEVKELQRDVILQISYLQYGRYMETGVKASQIRYPFAKARIAALMRWIRIKKLTSGMDKDVRSFAFAIAKKHAKVGMPSTTRYSRNGRVTGFGSYVFGQNQKKISDTIRGATGEAVRVALTDIINNITSEL